MTFASGVKDPALRGHVYLAMAHVLSRAGEVADARKAASQVDKPQTRVYAYSAVAKKCVELGDASLALEVLAECKRSFDGADKGVLQDGYDFLIGAYAECGFVREAREAGTHSRRPHSTDDRIAWELAQRGEAKEALSLAEGGQKISVATHTIEWDEDETDVALAIAAMREVPAGKEVDYALVDLVRALVKTRRLAEAREFVPRITDEYQQASSRGLIAAAEAADETLERIRARIEAAELVEEKLPLYRVLAQRFIQDGQFRDAEAAIEELVALVAASPRPVQASAFGELTDQGRLATVRALHAEIAAAYFKQGMRAEYERQMQLAAKAAAEMEPEAGVMKVMTLWQVLSVQLQADDLEGARETIYRVKAASEGTGGQRMSAFTVSNLAGEVAKRLIDRGDVDEGLAVAAEIHGNTVGLAISDVVKALVRAGRIDDAKAQMERLMAEGDAALAAMAADGMGELPVRRRAIDSDQVRAFQDVGAAMAAAGRDAELEAWLPGMPSDAMRAAACLGAGQPQTD